MGIFKVDMVHAFKSESRNSCYIDGALCFSFFLRARVILSGRPGFVYHQTPLFFYFLFPLFVS